MALIVEDGTGKSDAEAYISVADADTYIAAYIPSTAWDAFSTTQKEDALRQAAQYLDLVYGERWDGERLTKDQALDHPRSGVYLKGHLISTTEVASPVPDSNAEIAMRVAEGDSLLPVRENEDSKTVERIKIGPLEFEDRYAGGSNDNGGAKVYDRVELLLGPITSGGNDIERG